MDGSASAVQTELYKRAAREQAMMAQEALAALKQERKDRIEDAATAGRMTADLMYGMQEAMLRLREENSQLREATQHSAPLPVGDRSLSHGVQRPVQSAPVNARGANFTQVQTFGESEFPLPPNNTFNRTGYYNEHAPPFSPSVPLRTSSSMRTSAAKASTSTSAQVPAAAAPSSVAFPSATPRDRGLQHASLVKSISDMVAVPAPAAAPLRYVRDHIQYRQPQQQPQPRQRPQAKAKGARKPRAEPSTEQAVVQLLEGFGWKSGLLPHTQPPAMQLDAVTYKEVGKLLRRLLADISPQGAALSVPAVSDEDLHNHASLCTTCGEYMEDEELIDELAGDSSIKTLMALYELVASRASSAKEKTAERKSAAPSDAPGPASVFTPAPESGVNGVLKSWNVPTSGTSLASKTGGSPWATMNQGTDVAYPAQEQPSRTPMPTPAACAADIGDSPVSRPMAEEPRSEEQERRTGPSRTASAAASAASGPPPPVADGDALQYNLRPSEMERLLASAAGTLRNNTSYNTQVSAASSSFMDMPVSATCIGSRAGAPAEADGAVSDSGSSTTLPSIPISDQLLLSMRELVQQLEGAPPEQARALDAMPCPSSRPEP
eukprot:TRINITY_DN24732_c0_g1_i1.p1 TRINITY_DN24732_c0_g1~~TRINITY_DN24732_c0_g1_i1.p1  ORF type:complete len:607 (+),score=153.59 TRINITY_DN24732_c0_g1_i1:60-1880(+)